MPTNTYTVFRNLPIANYKIITFRFIITNLQIPFFLRPVPVKRVSKALKKIRH